jgi:rhodanese-related sulfurtransferase
MIVLVSVMAIAGLVSPLHLYHTYIGSVPTASPEEACESIGESGGRAVLVDLRDKDDFRSLHIEGAVSLPFGELARVRSAADLPKGLSGKRLFLVCYSGIRGARAAEALGALGVEATNIRDGMQGWIGYAWEPCVKRLKAVRATGGASGWPFRVSPYHEQLALFVSGYIVKPFYMLLAFALIIVLARIRSADTIALAIGMAFFLAGEDACAVEYLFFKHGSHLYEFLHSYGMLVGFGFMTWGFMEMGDRRLISYSDPAKRCAAILWCRECIKYKPVPCGLRNLFHFTIPAMIVLTAIPLTASPVSVSYNTDIFGVPYNFSHSVIYQLYETRWCPIAAVILLVLAEAALLFARTDPVGWARVFFAAAMGPFGFGMLRLVFVQVYRGNLVWFNFWEEITELLFVAGVAVLLVVFRKSFFLREKGVVG